MILPDVQMETFVKYTRDLIDSKQFPWLMSGALDLSASGGLPKPPFPYLHWFENDPYIYYGHEKHYDDFCYIDFTVAPLGVL